ncbi:MAG: alpha/beta fold hydrolase [Parachlamydiaceae bacterium]|nr:alpha/beta fold hydrolase [Parachlamydiaceae bacterium]
MLNKIIFHSMLLTSLVGGASANATIPLNSNLESIKETFVPSGEAKLFCRSAGKGKPLIIIHGSPGLSQDYLLPQMYELAHDNFVIFYDQRGCGKSTTNINAETITIKSFIEDIEAIRLAYNLDKISILGHSWGGFLGMQYAIKHPEHVDKLILSNSAPATSELYALFFQEYMKRMVLIQKELDRLTNSQEFRDGNTSVIEQFYRLIFRQFCYSPEKANLLDLYMNPLASINGAKVSEILNANVLGKPFDLNKSLNDLQICTLIVHGDVDPVPQIAAKNIHENIPGSKYILMKNCGHLPFVEDPVTYFKHIHEFLNRPLAEGN